MSTNVAVIAHRGVYLVKLITENVTGSFAVDNVTATGLRG